MQDVVRSLLDQLDKSLEDSKVLGRLGAGTVITFATAVLGAHSQSHEFICGLLKPEGIAFTAVAALALSLWVISLRLNLLEQHSIGRALTLSASASEELTSNGETTILLNTRMQFRKRVFLFWTRVTVVSIPLFIVWSFVVDIWPGDQWDPWGDTCASSSHCTALDASSVFEPVASPDGFTLPRNGAGLRQVEGYDVYFAALYLEKCSTDAESILMSSDVKMIEMYMLRPVTREQFARKFSKGIHMNCGEPCDVSEDDINSFVGVFPEKLSPHDRITLTFVPKSDTDSGQLDVSVNGGQIESLKNPTLTLRVLGNFLGPKLVDEEMSSLRADLLKCQE